VLGEKLLTAFESRSGLPYTRINLRSGSVTFHDWGDWYHNKACLAELASLELEFAVLSYHTNDERFLRTALNVIQVIKDAKKPIPGLYPSYMEIKYGTFFDNTYSVGSMADSFYEYLLKMWVLSHKTAFAFKSMYLVSARAILENLLQRSPSGLLYIGKMDGATENVEEEMEHLTCFFPGVLALGSYFRVSDDNRENLEHLKVAEDLAWSCYSMYSQQVTKLSADKTSFKEKKLKSVIPSFALRPETIESLFILHRITGKQNYREMAWDIFQAIEANCLHERGFAPLSDVSRESQSDGPMETFLIAETFKYLYLIFSDTDSISLDEFVFNTEAHPLKIRRDILSVLSKTKFI
jgi:mannosyl-oligosaccharide alpha-1,2-mannosidase